MKGRSILLLILAVAVSHSLTVVFHTDPVKAQWSGWTPAQQLYNYVSEVVTLNVDELGPPGYCELFSGSGGAQRYYLSVLTYPEGFEVASGETTETRDHVWVRCTLHVAHPESLIKGRRYEFHWSRANGARIQFYYNYCATRYDSMAVTEELDSRPVRVRIA